MGDVVSREKMEAGWTGGLPETPCGYGSTLNATRAQREWLPMLAERHSIKKVVDVGAGDLNWIGHVRWQVEYVALDIFPRHPSVIPFDATTTIPPRGADLVMCLWVLNHLLKQEAVEVLWNMGRSLPRFMLITNRVRWAADQPDLLNWLFQECTEDKLKLNDQGDAIHLLRFGA